MRVLVIPPLLQLLVISLAYISIDATQLVYDTQGNEVSRDFDYRKIALVRRHRGARF
jgi:hypothetical protein